MNAANTFVGTPPELVTERLVLRAIRPDDLHLVHEGLSDRRVTQHYDVHFATLGEARTQMQWFARNERDGSGRWWAICDRRNPRDYTPMIGACGVNADEVDAAAAEIGYWLLPGYWGQGFAGEAVDAMVEHVRDASQLTQLLARVDAPNIKSIAILERCGFVRERAGTPRTETLAGDEVLYRLAL